ncbi:MAG TPA: EthD domain-containing protein [Myxococcota bacterium]|nr:EthD domain-containing protein [Myxococcota bacterium]
MVEIFFLCARRAGLSHAEYAAHLLLRHAPLALRHHPRLRGYALHVVEESLGDSEPIDSVNALAFDSFADFAEHPYDSAEGERLVIEDHARFLGGAAGYTGHGQIHHDAQPGSELGVATPGTQWICALRRRARLSAARFHDALGSAFVPDLLAGQPGATRVAILEVERKLYAESAQDWDAFVQLGFADAARAPLHPFDSPDCGQSLRRRVAALCEATAVWRVREYVQRRAS